jgi:prolyl oligopeptidase
LQAATSVGDTQPILLRVETAAGHGQGKPATKQIDERADVLAFLASNICAGRSPHAGGVAAQT